MTTRLPLRFTHAPLDVAPAPTLDAWKLDAGFATADAPVELARSLVGVRSRGAGTVAVERIRGGAELIGHVVGNERGIPSFAPPADAVDTSAFGLDGPSPGGFVVLASASTKRLREIDPWFARRLPAFVGALCLPLAMVPTRAAASSSGPRRKAEEIAESEPEPTEPAATEPPSETVEAAQEPEAPVEPAPSLLPDSTWTALTGKTVVLTKADGFGLVGKLVAVDNTNASVAAQDGSVVVVPRASVTSVKLVHSEPADDDDDGPRYHGLLIGGSVMVAIGGSLAIAGAALTGYFAVNCTFTTTSGSVTTCSGISHPGFYAGVLLVPGLLMTGGGGAMLGVGVKRKKEAERRKAEITLLPRLQRNAWGGALQIRF